MTTSTMDRLFEEIDSLEIRLKKKYPKQKGRVILANIKTDIDYEIGKPSDSIEEMRWCRIYVDRLKSHLK